MSLVTRANGDMPRQMTDQDRLPGGQAVGDEEHHRAWRGTILPGDRMMAVLPAGATVELRGAGEHAE
eukprot:11179894-Lingulodinium_polyedra.AAC.1